MVQTAFEQCEEADKELIIGELLDEDAFGEVVTNAWGNFCILHRESLSYFLSNQFERRTHDST